MVLNNLVFLLFLQAFLTSQHIQAKQDLQLETFLRTTVAQKCCQPWLVMNPLTVTPVVPYASQPCASNLMVFTFMGLTESQSQQPIRR